MARPIHNDLRKEIKEYAAALLPSNYMEEIKTVVIIRFSKPSNTS